MTHHIVVLSGGMDSTVALATAARTSGDVEALSFHYGQRHERELEAARNIARHYGVRHRIVDIEGLLSGSALLGHGDVPEGHYADDTMAATVVPGRNLLFASAAIAQARPGDALWFGVHAGDHPIYPDCRPEFWHRLTALAADAYDVDIRTPFIESPKSYIAQQGARLGAPLDLSWSCYQGKDVHCGRCGTCVERAEAFALAKVADPTEYADPHYWKAVTA